MPAIPIENVHLGGSTADEDEIDERVPALQLSHLEWVPGSGPPTDVLHNASEDLTISTGQHSSTPSPSAVSRPSLYLIASFSNFRNCECSRVHHEPSFDIHA